MRLFILWRAAMRHCPLHLSRQCLYHLQGKSQGHRRPTGSDTRPSCRFRFRVAGWGQVNWRRVITSLATAGYDYVLSYEHEATMTSPEDGVEQCIERLRPQVVKKPLEAVWW